MGDTRIVPQSEDLVHRQSAFQEVLNAQWQRRLLPFMSWFVALIAITFLVLSAFDMVVVRKSIETENSIDVKAQIEHQIQSQKILLTPEQVTQQSLLILEADALNKRYHQANALLMSRIWTKHLAFITGVILALLGAVFILGKMTEDQSQITGGTGQWRIGITSASPGIILACLGTLLLLVATWAQTTITVNDRPVYVGPWISYPASSSEVPVSSAPPDIINSTAPKPK